MTYTMISKQQMDDFLSKYNAETVNYQTAMEYIYEFKIHDDLYIRIYSSVDKRSNTSRDIAKDAIRVLLCVHSSNGVVHINNGKVYRVDNWRENLRIKIDSLSKMIVNRCKICGNYMCLKNGKYGEFYGCINYPNCTYTESV